MSDTLAAHEQRKTKDTATMENINTREYTASKGKKTMEYQFKQYYQ